MSKKIGLIILCLAILCAVVGTIVAVYPSVAFGWFLDSIPSEASVPAYVTYGVLCWEGKALAMQQVLQNHNVAGQVAEVLAVTGDDVWLVYTQVDSSAEAWIWSLACVDFSGENLRICYSGMFATDYQRQNNIAKESANTKSGLYRDGKILLTDQKNLVEYCVADRSFRQMAAADYNWPKPEQTTDITDCQKISLTWKDREQVITSTDMAKASTVFAAILERCAGKTWGGASKTRFLYDSIQTDGKTLYIVCGLMNDWGETYAAVFQYDTTMGRFLYIFHEYIGDTLKDDFYIVPTA